MQLEIYNNNSRRTKTAVRYAKFKFPSFKSFSITSANGSFLSNVWLALFFLLPLVISYFVPPIGFLPPVPYCCLCLFTVFVACVVLDIFWDEKELRCAPMSGC